MGQKVNPHVILREGDVVSLDCGLILDGWQSDSAFTVGVGEIDPKSRQLIDVTEECFFKGARQAINGNHLGDIGHAIQAYAESFGYGVIRDLTGHGFDYGDEGEGGQLTARLWYPRMRNGVIEFCRPEECTVRRTIKPMDAKRFLLGENLRPVEEECPCRCMSRMSSPSRGRGLKLWR